MKMIHFQESTRMYHDIREETVVAISNHSLLRAWILDKTEQFTNKIYKTLVSEVSKKMFSVQLI